MAKKCPDPCYGMTVNERLFAAGLIEKRNAAARSRDRDEMVRLMISVDITEEQAEKTTDAALVDLGKYGF